MKKILSFLILILGCMGTSQAAAQMQISKSMALTIAKQEFKGQDVDYYVKVDNNATVWTIFVDAEPIF